MERSFFIAAAVAVLATSALAGCLYTDVRAPLAYGSATPGDVGNSLGKEVSGEACNTAIVWLVAFGDGGYDAAVKDARAKANATLLVDVKADTSYQNVLFGIYQKQCTTVTGRVPGPQPAQAAAASPPSNVTGATDATP